MASDQYKYDISICVITYNHALYICETLESIRTQDFTGKVQLVISDDASTDGTLDIIYRYASLFPYDVIINAISANVGPTRNVVETIKLCEGRYIAFLEGDDYWISDSKLTMQYEALESHAGCSLSYTKYYCYDENEGEYKVPDMPVENFSLEDLLNSMHPHGSTMMIKAEALKHSLDSEINNVPYTDVFIIMLALINGRSIMCDSFTSVYRLHNAGINSKVKDRKRIADTLKTRVLMDRYLRCEVNYLGKHEWLPKLRVMMAVILLRDRELIQAMKQIILVLHYDYKYKARHGIGALKRALVSFANKMHK